MIAPRRTLPGFDDSTDIHELFHELVEDLSQIPSHIKDPKAAALSQILRRCQSTDDRNYVLTALVTELKSPETDLVSSSLQNGFHEQALVAVEPYAG